MKQATAARTPEHPSTRAPILAPPLGPSGFLPSPPVGANEPPGLTCTIQVSGWGRVAGCLRLDFGVLGSHVTNAHKILGLVSISNDHWQE